MNEFERRMKEAEARAEQDIAEGIVREPVSAFRVMMEMGALAKRKGLSNREAHTTLVEFLRSKNISLDDFKRNPNKRENLDLVREAFAV